MHAGRNIVISCFALQSFLEKTLLRTVIPSTFVFLEKERVRSPNMGSDNTSAVEEVSIDDQHMVDMKKKVDESEQNVLQSCLAQSCKREVVVSTHEPEVQRHSDVCGSTTSIQDDQVKKFEGKQIDICKLTFKEEILGHGAFGIVCMGVYDDQKVAIKIVELIGEGKRGADLKSVFYKEIALWSMMDHPNITKFFGATAVRNNKSSSSFCYMVSEYLRGGSLKSYLKRNSRRKISFKKVVQIALDMAKGLSYLHSLNIIHRDVKSENMLVDGSGIVKVADFGLSRVKALAGEDEMTGKTGTLGYMSPEVLEGKPYDAKCDVYSFGFCLWEVYCCDMAIFSALLNKNFRPKVPKCCPKGLRKLMKSCWAADPRKRPEMKDVVSALEAIDTSKGGGMVPPENQPGCFCFFKRGP